MRELVTPSELAGIEKAAAKHGLRLRLTVKEYADGFKKYHFDHPEHRLWIFVLDRSRGKRRICFEKRFIEVLRQNSILADVEKGGGKNGLVEEKDFEKALRVCTVGLTQPDI